MAVLAALAALSLQQRSFGSGDLNALVPEFNLDAKTSTNCLYVFSKRVNLGSLDVPVLNPRYPVLAHVQASGEFHLGEIGSLAQLAETVSPDLFEEPLFMGVHGGPANRTLGQQVFDGLRH